jgi:glycosyltransferase involved in cell wall biosynthesis
MKIAILSYPMLFQTSGGLSMKVNKTIEALNDNGIYAKIPNLITEKLVDYDLIHVFAPYNGNYRIIEQAKNCGLPVVVSTILNVQKKYNKWDLVKVKTLTKLVGKATNWHVTTSYNQIHRALTMADHLIALGDNERNELNQYYQQPLGKISIIYNGVAKDFFSATPDLFDTTYNIPHPFVLHTGIIGPVKNQLGLIRALKHENLHIVLIGYSDVGSKKYLTQCIEEGCEKVHYLGEFAPGDPQLISAYAAADVVAIPSQHEGMPNSIMEALASDTPSVLTKNNALDLKLSEDVAIAVDPQNEQEIRHAVLKLLTNPPPIYKCRKSVSHLTWDAVATQLEQVYSNAIKNCHEKNSRIMYNKK